MIIDAIVLAGGRATRLGGTSKAALPLAGGSLLENTLAAVAFARRIVVVGDETDILAAAPDAAAEHPGLLIVREIPAFGGPAAAIAAGVEALGGALDASPSDTVSSDTARSNYTVVVGCDMPALRNAIDVLLAAVQAGADGAVAVSSDGRPQQLVGVYSSRGLADRVTRHRDAGDLENLSVRALLSGLDSAPVSVPVGSTDDVDTWADAARLGILTPQPNQRRNDNG